MSSGKPLFVYGTLMQPDVQERVIGRTLDERHARLPGYGIDYVRIDGRLYPAIKPESNSTVHGRLLRVTDEEMRRIDDYEGEHYERVGAGLEDGSHAYVYVRRAQKP